MKRIAGRTARQSDEGVRTMVALLGPASLRGERLRDAPEPVRDVPASSPRRARLVEEDPRCGPVVGGSLFPPRPGSPCRRAEKVAGLARPDGGDLVRRETRTEGAEVGSALALAGSRRPRRCRGARVFALVARSRSRGRERVLSAGFDGDVAGLGRIAGVRRSRRIEEAPAGRGEPA